MVSLATYRLIILFSLIVRTVSFTGCDQTETRLNERSQELEELESQVATTVNENEHAEQLAKENADLTQQIADLKSAQGGSESVIEQEV
ncbi:MAG: hypothetical protein ACKVH8_11105 [Pirellulales bacterium]